MVVEHRTKNADVETGQPFEMIEKVCIYMQAMQISGRYALAKTEF